MELNLTAGFHNYANSHKCRLKITPTRQNGRFVYVRACALISEYWNCIHYLLDFLDISLYANCPHFELQSFVCYRVPELYLNVIDEETMALTSSSQQ